MGHDTLERLGMDLLTLHTLLNQTLRPGQQPLPADLAWTNTCAKCRAIQHAPRSHGARHGVYRHAAPNAKAARPTSFVARQGVACVGRGRAGDARQG